MNVGTENVLYLGELQKISCKPGDVFVLSCEQTISVNDAARIKVKLEEQLPPGVRVLVLDSGLKYAVVAP